MSKQAQYDWIIERFKFQTDISGTDAPTHEAFNDAFGFDDIGGWRVRSRQLMRRLRELYLAGKLKRGTIGIWAGYSGDPKWTVTYSLRD